MRVRWVLLVTLFLTFACDFGAPYEQMAGPLSLAHWVLFEAWPDKIRGIDHITVVCLVLAVRSADGKGPRVMPVRNALLLAVGTTIFFFIYGVARGGGAWEASWQVYLMLSGLLMAFAIAAAFRTPEHFLSLWKMILWSGAYRAFWCILFWTFYIRNGAIFPAPEFLTSHDDTVLWVVGLMILILRMIEAPTAGARWKMLLLAIFIGAAVLFNQRRIAWVSLAMGIILLFVLLRPGKQKKRAMRVVYAIMPVVLLYVAIGWGRTERIFKPLQSFATVSTQEDNSTKARNVENLGLIATSEASGPLFGTGWGHPYVEVSNHYSIARYFPLWQYVPHNSILGLLAYTGILGFFGYWLIYPTSMFFNARMARFGNTQAIRGIGIIGATTLVVCANQFYGDMGIYYMKSVYILAFAYAIALRLPIMAEVWPAPGARKPRQPPAPAPAPTPRAA